MPKVIVYVPAAAWRKLEARGLDPAKAVREFAKRGYEVENGHLPERGVGGVTQLSAPATVGQSTGLESRRTEEAESTPPARTRSGSCPMQPARGTKCKACGKVHPL